MKTECFFYFYKKRMKFSFGISIVFLFFTSITFSQTTFQKIFSGTNHNYGTAVQQTVDKGYIVAGYTNCYGSGNNDVYLIKCDAMGGMQWSKTYGGTGDDRAWSVQQTTDGGYIISGQTTLMSGGDNFYLLKTDSAGSILWTKTYGGTGNYNHGYSVQQTTDGGYIIAGYENEFGAGGIDIYVVKTDSLGAIIWTKTYGDTSNDYALSIQQTTDGGYIITGTSYSTAYAESICLIKIDALGNIVWSKVFGGSNSDYGSSVRQTFDGGYVIIGQTYSFGAGDYDIYLIKTDSNGTILWTKIFGGTGSDQGYSVEQTSDNGYIIVGSTNSYGTFDSDVYMIKTDSVGTPIWTKTFGGYFADFGNSVKQTIDGGYVIAGYTGSFGAGYIYLIKTDSIGNSGCYEANHLCLTDTGGTSIPHTIITGTGGTSYTPSTLTGSGGLGGDVCALSGINKSNVLENSIIIYPNPFSTSTTIQTDEKLSDATLTIYNSVGQQVKQIKNIFGQTVIIHKDNLVTGLYFFNLTQGSKIISSKKFVITD